jgi:uncharacterized protein
MNFGADLMPAAALPTISRSRASCRRKPRKEDVSPDDLCNHCSAKCCRYFALAIDTPEDWQDFDYIRWYLLHERAAVFIEDKSWYLLVDNPCKHLGDDNLCGIYETRPQICRDYTTADCEYDDDFTYDLYWDTPEQVEEYALKLLGPRKNKSVRRAKSKAATKSQNPKIPKSHLPRRS